MSRVERGYLQQLLTLGVITQEQVNKALLPDASFPGTSNTAQEHTDPRPDILPVLVEPSSPSIIVATSLNIQQNDKSINSDNVYKVVGNPVQAPQPSPSTVPACSNCNQTPCVIANACCVQELQTAWVH